MEDSWDYEIEEYAPGAIVYDGRGEAYRANEEGFLIPLDLDFDSYYIRQKVRMVFDKVSANHAAHMEKYTELKDTDPEAAQRVHDELMGRA